MSKEISELEYWGVHYFHELYVNLYKTDMNSEAMKQHLIDRWGEDIIGQYWRLYKKEISAAVYKINELDS